MDPFVYRIGALALTLLVTLVIGTWVARRRGRARPVAPGERLTADDLSTAGSGAPALGSTATLLQFSTPVCTGCPPTRRVLAGIAAAVPGVVHLDVDATRRPELVRRLGVHSTPTTFVLDADGQVRGRLAGPPTPAQVHEALALASGGPAPTAATRR